MNIINILIGAFAGGLITILTTLILKKRARFIIERSDEEFKQGHNLPIGANLLVIQGDREIKNFQITSFIVTNESTTDFENVNACVILNIYLLAIYLYSYVFVLLCISSNGIGQGGELECLSNTGM